MNVERSTADTKNEVLSSHVRHSRQSVSKYNIAYNSVNRSHPEQRFANKLAYFNKQIIDPKAIYSKNLFINDCSLILTEKFLSTNIWCRLLYLAVRWPGIPKVSRSRPTDCSKSCHFWPAFAPCNTWSSVRTALCWLGDNDQSIESTVSDATVRSRLWSTGIELPFVLLQ